MKDKVDIYRERANGKEGKGTGRSDGSNKRLMWLANVRDCRKQGGKGCKKKR